MECCLCYFCTVQFLKTTENCRRQPTQFTSQTWCQQMAQVVGSDNRDRHCKMIKKCRMISHHSFLDFCLAGASLTNNSISSYSLDNKQFLYPISRPHSMSCCYVISSTKSLQKLAAFSLSLTLSNYIKGPFHQTLTGC